MSVKRKQVDMLNGSLIDKIVLFALPLAASSVLQQLFNAADLAVVGRFASSTAMAAVGSNSSLISLLLSLFMGLSLGSNVLIATYIGRGHKEEINIGLVDNIPEELRGIDPQSGASSDSRCSFRGRCCPLL